MRSLAFFALLAPAAAFATSGGVVGYSGKGGIFCTSCHGVGAGTVPTVAIEGPASLATGEVATYTVRITGGPGVRGGTNVAASTAAVGLAAGPGLVLEGGELRHTAPKAFASGNTSWTFFVTAPPTAGTFTLYAAGNSCNGMGSGGDRSATTTRAITVTASNQPPVISVAPSAAVTSPTTRTLTVTATDDGPATALTYTWEATTAPQPVTFSVNGTNAARTTVATFTRAGAYSFVLTVRDAAGASAVRAFDVTVAAAVTSASVQPASAGVPASGTQQFTASATDQFGATITPPPAFTWMVSGGGTVSATGLFTAGATLGGPHTITATASGRMATAQVTVANGTPPVIAGMPSVTPRPVTGRTAALAVTATDDGGEGALGYTWSASGPAPVTFTPNGSNAARASTATFARAGTYLLVVVARDAAGLTDSASISVTVDATPTTVSITPAMVTVPRGGRVELTGAVVDQFDQPVMPAPALTWTLSGGGTINAMGQLIAGAVTGGPHTITATAGGLSGTATLFVSSGGPPSLTRMPVASPAVVLGRTALLNVLAADDTGEANLVYHWQGTGPAEVLFSDNGTNAGKSSVATFTRAGSYELEVTVEDPSKASVKATLQVEVMQSLTGVSITPGAVVVPPSGTHQFTAKTFDQFGSPQPSPVEWSVSGGGQIDANGLFTASGEASGPWAVRAVSMTGLRSSAEVVVGTPGGEPEPLEPQVEQPKAGQVIGEYTGCSTTGGHTALIAAMVLTFWLLRRRNGWHARMLHLSVGAPLSPSRSATSLGAPRDDAGTPAAQRAPARATPQVNLMVKRALLLSYFAAAATVLVSSTASAQMTAEARARCATRLSAALLAQPPSTALLGAMNPQDNVDTMLTTAVFRERFARFINAKFNGEPGATPAEDASYYLARYVLENNRPWRELFNGQYRVQPGATATADAVVVADPNGLGYFRSRPWMIRYAGNEIDGYRIVAAYRIMNNVLGLKLVAAVNTDGIDAAGRMSSQCSGCHYNTTFGLDYAAKILSRKFGEGDAMTFGAPNEGPQPLLGGQMISNDAQLVNAMVASTDFRFNVCRTAMEFLYARAEFKCEGPVFDACMTAFQSAGTMTSALAAIAKAPGFCQ